MNLKKNLLKVNNIGRYVTVFIILANIIALYFIYGFFYEYLYKTYFYDNFPTVSRTRTDDINIENFESVLEELNSKQAKNQISEVRNIFY